MIKVKRNYYLKLAVYSILLGILIGSFFYLLNHAIHHKDYAIYYYIGAFLLFMLGCVLGLICKAEIYCFPLQYAAEKEILIEAKTQEIINEGIKKGIVISTEEIIECLCKQDEEKDFYSTKEDLALYEKSKQDFRDKHGSAIPIATVYEIAKKNRELYPDKYDRIIAIINTRAYGYFEGSGTKKLSGWNRMFIIFAGVWTVLSIGIISTTLYEYKSNVPYPTIERTETLIRIEDLLRRRKEPKGTVSNQGEPVDIQREHKQNLREYYKGRRKLIFLFPLYWLVPIGFVYGTGWTIAWIIRGFHKEKQRMAHKESKL